MSWLSQAANLIAKAIKKQPPGTVLPTPEPTGPEPRAPAPAPISEDKTWRESLLRALPLAMLILGALLSSCGELIGSWVLLGYLLLVATPIVFWLGRLDQRLVEMIKSLRSGPRR